MPLLDVRVLSDPLYRQRDGDEEHRAAVRAHPLFAEYVERAVSLYEEHGALAVGCDWGRHRSWEVAHEAADRLGVEAVSFSEVAGLGL